MSSLHQTMAGFKPCSPKWSTGDIPDLSCKVVIVTGGNTGIGKETVKALLLKNAKVYMASRSKDRAFAAIAELKAETGKDAIFLQLDLANLDSITQAAQEFKSKERCLHILFNSGGVFMVPIDQLTSDGFDLQFGTNVLGHAHFTLSLIPELIEGAKTSSDGKARVVNTSSDSAYLGVPKNGIDWNTLRDGVARKKMGTMTLYCQSKFANVVFSNELARRYASQGIISNSLNPGHLKTDLQRHMSSVQRTVLGALLYPAPMGALTQLYVGTSPETANNSGDFFVPWARLGKLTGPSADPEMGRRLWDWIEEQRRNH
ncbi:hypothetical protein FRB94_001991 [Tulasnella sp. JGI-2019a]|nr:hypothetical protein FRB94_001991 [Tulasnella sp. JGI-2019a]